VGNFVVAVAAITIIMLDEVLLPIDPIVIALCQLLLVLLLLLLLNVKDGARQGVLLFNIGHCRAACCDYWTGQAVVGGVLCRGIRSVLF
jgi:hypothetical protein